MNGQPNGMDSTFTKGWFPTLTRFFLRLDHD